MADDEVSSSTSHIRDEESTSSEVPARKKPRTDDSTETGQSSASSADDCASTTPAITSNGDSHKQSTTFAVNQTYINGLQTLKKLYLNESTTDESDEVKFVNENCLIQRDPFQVVQLKNFVQDDTLLNSMMNVVTKTKLSPKNNDLYSLKQSADLSSINAFESICNFFENNVRSFLQNLTGITLNSKVALTISRYDENDYLLCHDDQLDDRKIAFILYLVEKDWTAEDGGQLELFKCNSEDFQPVEVVTRLTPEWNLFNFFVVQPTTYHQVSEVKTSRAPRWSINGWFHGDSQIVIPRNYTFPSISQIRPPISAEKSLSYDILLSWINPNYVLDDNQAQVQESFVNKSEIQLKNFLRTEKYVKLANALKSEEVMKIWKRYFSPVLAKYEYIPERLVQRSSDENTPTASLSELTSSQHDVIVPEIVREAFELFSSEAFVLLVSNMTGIRLHRLAVIKDDDEDENREDDEELQIVASSSSSSKAPKSKEPKDPEAKCRGEIRRWQIGDYSLASNVAPEYAEESAIDVMFFLNVINYDNEVINLESESEDESEDENADENVDDESLPGPSTSGTAKEVVSSSNSKSTKNDDQEVIDITDDDEENDEEDSDEEDISDDDVVCVSDNESDIEHEELRPGGRITYIDENTNFDLLGVKPANNSLNIVYRLKGTQRFMKYLTARNKSAPFNEISFVYYEK